MYSGEILEVKEVFVEYLDKPVKVYNFEVGNWHTYFVSEYNVFVHNTGCGGTGKAKLPNQGTVKGNVEGAPPVDAGKQGKHVPGHNNNNPLKSQWPAGETRVDLTQEAWMKGTPVKPDGSVGIYDNGTQRIKVHIDTNGNLHGYPVD